MYNSQIDYKTLTSKWGKVLNEDADGAVKKLNDKSWLYKQTALVLENQFKYMLESGINPEMLTESSWTQVSTDNASYATDGNFHKIAIPMIRRIFPELVAHDLVGVQPMPSPTSLAFALRYKTPVGATYSGATSGVELGYNTVDANYSGSYTTSTGEALGSTSAGTIYNGLGFGTGAAIAEVNLTMEKAQVTAKTRKLRSRWSNEVAQDLRAMHGLDIEKEMMDILAYEITQEIDREIITKIRTVAATNPGSKTGGNALSWTSSANFDGRWEAERYRTLFNRIIRDANKIAISTRRGPGNFVVTDPTISAALECTSSFTIAPVKNTVDTSIFGVSKVGSLDGRLALYRDTFYTGNPMYTVGFKGNSIFDAGIIYCPYVQLMFSKATLEESFNPTIGVQTRYGILDNLFGSWAYYISTEITNMP